MNKVSINLDSLEIDFNELKKVYQSISEIPENLNKALIQFQPSVSENIFNPIDSRITESISLIQNLTITDLYLDNLLKAFHEALETYFQIYPQSNLKAEMLDVSLFNKALSIVSDLIEVITQEHEKRLQEINLIEHEIQRQIEFRQNKVSKLEDSVNTLEDKLTEWEEKLSRCQSNPRKKNCLYQESKVEYFKIILEGVRSELIDAEKKLNSVTEIYNNFQSENFRNQIVQNKLDLAECFKSLEKLKDDLIIAKNALENYLQLDIENIKGNVNYSSKNYSIPRYFESKPYKNRQEQGALFEDFVKKIYATKSALTQIAVDKESNLHINDLNNDDVNRYRVIDLVDQNLLIEMKNYGEKSIIDADQLSFYIKSLDSGKIIDKNGNTHFVNELHYIFSDIDAAKKHYKRHNIAIHEKIKFKYIDKEGKLKEYQPI